MPIVSVQDLLGAGLEEYDRLVAEVGDQAPPGLILRAAGPTERGWRTIDVWESKVDLQRFEVEALRPALERSGISWFGRWVTVEELAVHHLLRQD